MLLFRTYPAAFFTNCQLSLRAKQRLAQIGISIFKNSVPMKPVEVRLGESSRLSDNGLYVVSPLLTCAATTFSALG